MSNIFTYLVRETGGVIPLNLGGGDVPPDARPSQGLRLDANGAVYAQHNGSIDHYHQGLPFNLFGRLVVNITPTSVQRIDQSIPFDTNDRVAIGGDGSYANQGLAYSIDGFLADAPLRGFQFNMLVGQGGGGNNLFGFDYHGDPIPYGEVTPRSGFDRTNDGNTFANRVSGSNSTDNFTIRFTNGDTFPGSPDYIRLDNAGSIIIDIEGVGEASAGWREAQLDYFIAGGRIPGFGAAMEALLGEQVRVNIRWIANAIVDLDFSASPDGTLLSALPEITYFVGSTGADTAEINSGLISRVSGSPDDLLYILNVGPTTGLRKLEGNFEYQAPTTTITHFPLVFGIDPDNLVGVRYHDGDLELFEVVGGVSTLLGTSVQLAIGALISLELEGTNVRVLTNNNVAINTTTTFDGDSPAVLAGILFRAGDTTTILSNIRLLGILST